jgi:hypothetical protein
MQALKMFTSGGGGAAASSGGGNMQSKVSPPAGSLRCRALTDCVQIIGMAMSEAAKVGLAP